MAIIMCSKCHGKPAVVTVPSKDERGIDDQLCLTCARKRGHVGRKAGRA